MKLKIRIPAGPRHLFAWLLASALLVLPAGATWSIVVVDMETGEMGVASATCILNDDLELFVPAIRVGYGAGAAQSSVDQLARNRKIMYRDFKLGLSSESILEDIEINGPGNMRWRQFGIVSAVGDPVTFTGVSCGRWRGGLVGQIGSLKYAIQGNVLTGRLVIEEAERALLTTPGDLSQRMMAGMHAARFAGGDGRCSCSTADPTSCGSPPVEFDKSAHTAFVILSRIGDTNGPCNKTVGCASGDYYLMISRHTGAQGPDPMVRVQADYDTWRAGLASRPDHLLSTVTASALSVPADGLTDVHYTVQLVDLEGVALTSGGAAVVVATASGTDAIATVGPVSDNGDGTYGFDVTGGTQPGTEGFVITVDDGTVAVTLYPYPELRVDPVAQLHAGLEKLSIFAGGDVPFVVNDPAFAGSPYVLLATVSGTAPGQSWGSLNVPLNPDEVFLGTLLGAGGPYLPGSVGSLDGQGRAEAAFHAPPGLLLGYLELRMDWAAVFYGAAAGVTPTVGFDLVP